MSLVEPDPCHDALDRLVDCGIREDDVRTLAAQFKRHSLSRAGAGERDPLPDLGRSREGDLVDALVFDQSSSGLTRTRDDVDHALRKFALLEDFREPKCGERGGLCRLEHDRIAAGERRSKLPRRHQQGKVPGNDLRTDPDGPWIRVARNGPSQLVAPPCMVEEVLRHQWNVDVPTLLDGLATVDGLEDRELPCPLLDSSCDPVEVLCSGQGTCPRPLAECRSRCCYCGIDISLARFSERGDRLFVRRVDGVETSPAP